MEDIDKRLNQLIEYASRVDIKHIRPDPVSFTAIMQDTSNNVEDRLNFADADDIILMQKYLGLSKKEILDDDNIQTMSLLSSMAQSVDIPLYRFLLSIGNKIGGRLSSGFSERLRIYIRLLLEEDDMTAIARKLIGSRSKKEYVPSEISKIVSEIKKEIKLYK